MPSVIPYDPEITLGNIVDPSKIAILERISAEQAPIDAAENEMNSLISLKRSLDSTSQELSEMGIDTEELDNESRHVAEDIKKSAVEYAKIKLAGKENIQKLKADVPVSMSWESPIDYNRSQIKSFPLSADSMNMNVQYFSKDTSSQSSRTSSMSIQEFISSEFKFLGYEFADQASKAAASQVNSQYSRHDIAGTLVIAVSCTHKNASIFAPCIIDVDKAIRVWNAMYADDMLKTDDPASIIATAANAQTKSEGSFSIVSGATYGSCFVGMVHILNTSHTVSAERMNAIASSIQAQCNVQSWFAKASGGFGIGSSFANDVKNMLSTQDILSHCTLTTRGAIPSIKSNQIKLAVQQYTNFDGKSAMENLAALQNATASDKDSVDNSAQAARLGQQMIALKNAQIKGVLEGLSEIDDGNNQILDINSLMTAFEDYTEKAMNGEAGMPINYYLKRITKSDLAEMWVQKYFPDKFLKVTSNEDEKD